MLIERSESKNSTWFTGCTEMWLYLSFLWSQLSLPVLSHSAHHLPGSSSAAHLSLLKDTNYTSLHHGGPFHSNTLQGHSSLAEVPMWFQPVSDGPFHAWPEVHGWTTAHSPIISSLLSSVSVCVHTALIVLTGCWHLLLHLFQGTNIFPVILLYEAAWGMVLAEQNSELFLL